MSAAISVFIVPRIPGFQGRPCNVTVPAAASVVHRDRHTARGGVSTEGEFLRPNCSTPRRCSARRIQRRSSVGTRNRLDHRVCEPCSGHPESPGCESLSGDRKCGNTPSLVRRRSAFKSYLPWWYSSAIDYRQNAPRLRRSYRANGPRIPQRRASGGVGACPEGCSCQRKAFQPLMSNFRPSRAVPKRRGITACRPALPLRRTCNDTYTPTACGLVSRSGWHGRVTRIGTGREWGEPPKDEM